MNYRAVFIGWQQGWRDLPPVPLFNVVDPGCELFKSTVTAMTLHRVGMTVDEIKWYK